MGLDANTVPGDRAVARSEGVLELRGKETQARRPDRRVRNQRKDPGIERGM